MANARWCAYPVRRSRLALAAIAVMVSTFLIGCVRESAPKAPWVLVLDNGRAVVGLDTSRLVRDSVGAHVWIRVDMPPQPLPGDSTQIFVRLEANEVVDCHGRRVQDERVVLRNAAQDSIAGWTVRTPVWKSYNEQGMTVYLFDPLCATLGRLAQHTA